MFLKVSIIFVIYKGNNLSAWGLICFLMLLLVLIFPLLRSPFILRELWDSRRTYFYSAGTSEIGYSLIINLITIETFYNNFFLHHRREIQLKPNRHFTVQSYWDIIQCTFERCQLLWLILDLRLCTRKPCKILEAFHTVLTIISGVVVHPMTPHSPPPTIPAPLTPLSSWATSMYDRWSQEDTEGFLTDIPDHKTPRWNMKQAARHFCKQLLPRACTSWPRLNRTHRHVGRAHFFAPGVTALLMAVVQVNYQIAMGKGGD